MHLVEEHLELGGHPLSKGAGGPADAWGGVRLRPEAEKKKKKRRGPNDHAESNDSVRGDNSEERDDAKEAVQRSAFEALSRIPSLCADDLAATWSLEMPGDADVVVPSAVLAGEPSSSNLPRRFYSSFILKRPDHVKDILASLPVDRLPSDGRSRRTATTINHGKAVWFFVGHNKSRRVLPGRPEHTDAVRHDGTWHFQLSGSKTWHLRPTKELAQRLAANHGEDGAGANRFAGEF